MVTLAGAAGAGVAAEPQAEVTSECFRGRKFKATYGPVDPPAPTASALLLR